MIRYPFSYRLSRSRSAFRTIVVLTLAIVRSVRADLDHGGRVQLTEQLNQKYIGACPQNEAEMERGERFLERIAISFDSALASSETSVVPSEDIAVLALLSPR